MFFFQSFTTFYNERGEIPVEILGFTLQWGLCFRKRHIRILLLFSRDESVFSFSSFLNMHGTLKCFEKTHETNFAYWMKYLHCSKTFHKADFYCQTKLVKTCWDLLWLVFQGLPHTFFFEYIKQICRRSTKDITKSIRSTRRAKIWVDVGLPEIYMKMLKYFRSIFL